MNNETDRTSIRNGFIDAQKLFYAWIIVIFHFYIPTREHLKGGGNATDFFLIVSGAFFFAGYWRKTQGLNREDLLCYPCNYMKKRLLRFFPHTVPAFILAFVVSAVIAKDGYSVTSISGIIDAIVKNVWEIPLISMCGLNAGKAMLNGVTWTISAMLIAEFVILNLLVRGEKTFYSCLAPMAILMGCGFWAQIAVFCPLDRSRDA